MIWDIIAFIIFWTIGTSVYSMVFLQVILTITSSIPITIKLRSVCDYPVKTKGVVTKMLLITTLWTTISSAIILLLLNFGSTPMKIGFGLGVVVGFVLSLSKLGVNKDNLGDYLDFYAQYYNQNDITKITELYLN